MPVHGIAGPGLYFDRHGSGPGTSGRNAVGERSAVSIRIRLESKGDGVSLRQGLKRDIEPDYVCSLITAHHLMPDDPPLDIRQWPWSVSLYCLGRFNVMVNAKNIGFSRKTQYKPLDMLKFIIGQGRAGHSGLCYPGCALARQRWRCRAQRIHHHTSPAPKYADDVGCIDLSGGTCVMQYPDCLGGYMGVGISLSINGTTPE